ncbi:MAG: DNA polymerase III subunit alpha [Candidatus Sericytochromatia bacterium]|nr:DNA polymerase III subunit alpha [Candidatus Tanganyikabacteria bacterium]
MARGKFVHCHAHSQYSLLDGASRVKDMVARAVECEMPAIAVTDHGVMYGAVEFYYEARKAGIKPLLGMEAYVAFGDRREKSAARTGKHYGHLVLIAKDQKGYENLVKLNTIGHLEGYYHKPRIDREVLSQFSEGLVALSACIGGQVPQMVLQKRFGEAEELALWYKSVFGSDFYLELQDHGLADQHTVNRAFLELSERTGIPLVATNDSHYTKPDDTAAHDALICIGTGQIVADPNRKMAYGPDFYIKSAEQMYEIFHDVPEACRNTLEVASKCNVVLEMGRSRLPVYSVPESFTTDTYLIDLAQRGLRRRYNAITPELEHRLEYELGVITQMGFPAYFLIVSDFIMWAKDRGIPVGPGRGSAAGSLVAYCLGITDLDPVKYNLLFERFLNPERVSMPDIDVDFCIDRRGEVIKYVREKYGEDRVSQIVTFNTMKAKAAIKDVARVMGLSFTEANDLCKKVPDELNITLEAATAEGTELYAEMQRNERARQVIEMARRLEGLTRNTSIHAAGVVIAEEPLDTLVPLTRLDKDEVGGVSTQYEQKYLEMLGLLKMDFLGLRNLTMIGRAIEMIERNHGLKVDFSNQDFTDPKVYEFLRTGDTIGIFQVESEGMTKLIKRLQPTSFEDISAILALYRPGPLQTGYVDKYVDRRHGREKIEYPHPLLEPILRDTYGTMVYQEQIMQIAQVLAGYSLGGADLLRRAMGKKKADEMAKQRAIFLEGCRQNEVDEKVANAIFDDMEKFSEYCFNRAHTAAYAVLTYQTAWLKTYYPREYMAALLSSYIGSMDKIQLTVLDCRHMGIEVLPPDVNSSGSDFTVVPEGIRFGLGAVKNVGLSAVEEIVRKREGAGGRFKDAFDFFEKVDQKLVNKRCIESLVLCGGFDSFAEAGRFNRARFLGDNLDALVSWASDQQRGANSGQFSLFAGMEELVAPPRPNLIDVPPMDPAEALKAEKDMIGLYLSGHPLNYLPTRLEWHTTATAKALETVVEPRPVVVGGLIYGCRKILTKRGDMMMSGKLEDFTGSIDWVMFPKAFETYGSFLADDAKMLLKGKYSRGNDDRQQIEVEHVWELGNLVSCHVHLPPGIDGAYLVGLKEACRAHKGDIPVILHFDGRTEEVVAGDAFWVDRSASLDAALARVLGDPERIKWHEPRPLLSGAAM